MHGAYNHMLMCDEGEALNVYGIGCVDAAVWGEWVKAKQKTIIRAVKPAQLQSLILPSSSPA